jgi:hypothetical protein
MKTELTLPGGPTVDADVSKEGLVAVHRPLGEKTGYVLTEVASGRVYCWAPLKKTVLEWRAQIERSVAEGRDGEYLEWLVHFMRSNSKKS